MHYLSKLAAFIAVVLGTCSPAFAQTRKTQSIIYDATTLMNASHGMYVLLLPQSAGWDIENPLNGKKDSNAVEVTPASYLNSASAAKAIIEILRRNADLPGTATDEQVIAAYANNPFLKDLSPAFVATVAPDSSFLKVEKIITDAGVGGIANDLLGNLVNGTADFLIKRSQEEISISIFERLKKFITRYPELDTLFPRTCALIKPVEGYEYNKALDAFKAAIKEDLKNFIAQVPALYSIPRYNQLNKRVASLTLVFTACSLFNDLHADKNLAQSMYNLHTQNYLAEQNNYAAFTKLLTEISNSLLDKTLSDPEDKARNYIKAGYIDKVTHSNLVLKGELGRFYLGLLWQHIQSININAGGVNRSFAVLLNATNTTDKLTHAIETVSATITTVYKLDSTLTVIKNKEFTDADITGKLELKAKRFVLYSEMVSHLLDFSTLFTDNANGNYAIRVQEIAKYLPPFTTGVTNIIKDFYKEEYNLGISDLEQLLRTVSDYLKKVQDDKAMKAELVNNLDTALNGQKNALDAQVTALNVRIDALKATTIPAGNMQMKIDIETEVQELTISKQDVEASLTAVNYQLKHKEMVLLKLSKVIEYVHLFASITKAENSKAVEELLETYALPAGSSRIKKVSNFNMAVNSYVGGFGARSKDMGEGFTNTYGLTAPIGLTISHGWEKAGSASLFLGVFDIGGTIRYKLDTKGQYQQNITLAGIVSPGVHAVYGFPWYLPISFGVGCQWISPTTANANKIDLKPTFNAFLAVDIPLFNLTAVQKK